MILHVVLLWVERTPLPGGGLPVLNGAEERALQSTVSTGASLTSGSFFKSRMNSSRYPHWTKSSRCRLRAQQCRVAYPRLPWKEQFPAFRESQSCLAVIGSSSTADAWWRERFGQSTASEGEGWGVLDLCHCRKSVRLETCGMMSPCSIPWPISLKVFRILMRTDYFGKHFV